MPHAATKKRRKKSKIGCTPAAKRGKAEHKRSGCAPAKTRRRPKPVAPTPAAVAPAPTAVDAMPTRTPASSAPSAPPPAELAPAPASTLPTVPFIPAPAGTPAPPAPAPATPPPLETPVPEGLPHYAGPFGAEQARRLLWRAGFGPRPGDAERLSALGLESAVLSLTRPQGLAALLGLAAHSPDNTWTLDPTRKRGHDHLYWMDRMVRSDQQLVERLALVFHDWFATNVDQVGSQEYMLAQTNLFREHGLGCFRDLVVGISADPAMIQFLDQNTSNVTQGINENFARELMELFTLGADRGAYTEADVRELARAVSGWRNDWADTGGYNFRWDPSWWDDGAKTVFGETGALNWEDACRMVVDHPMHASFFVAKLWGYFVADALPAADGAALERLYVESGHQIRPVLESILMHPLFYAGASMIKPPVVAIVGMMRAREQAITRDWWWWVCANAGQWLYHPPDVAGWRDDAWLDTSTIRYRFEAVHYVMENETENPGSQTYPLETAAQAVENAVRFWPGAQVADETRQALRAWAESALPLGADSSLHAQRQNALRHLVGVSPDYNVC